MINGPPQLEVNFACLRLQSTTAVFVQRRIPDKQSKLFWAGFTNPQSGSGSLYEALTMKELARPGSRVEADFVAADWHGCGCLRR